MKTRRDDGEIVPLVVGITKGQWDYLSGEAIGLDIDVSTLVGLIVEEAIRTAREVGR